MMLRTDYQDGAIHPRTTLWWQQQAKCSTCRHMRRKKVADGTGEVLVWQCSVPLRGLAMGHPDRKYCISMRDEGAPCGPEAKLHAPRSTTR
jgi:hypothetical protein